MNCLLILQISYLKFAIPCTSIAGMREREREASRFRETFGGEK